MRKTCKNTPLTERPIKTNLHKFNVYVPLLDIFRGKSGENIKNQELRDTRSAR